MSPASARVRITRTVIRGGRRRTLERGEVVQAYVTPRGYLRVPGRMNVILADYEYELLDEVVETLTKGARGTAD